MHMADAMLSPAVGATFWTGSLATITYCSKKLREYPDEKLIPLMGVLGAFIFAAQMINFTIPGTGSSGHIGGGMILAIILGSRASFLVMASVLTVQALFFADGGLLALGCNIWNLGIYPSFIAYPLIYKPIVHADGSLKRIVIASVISAVLGLQMGAFSVVTETMLSGRSELPFGTFVLMMQTIHLGIGIVEGMVTAGVISFVRNARPELLERLPTAGTVTAGASSRKLFVTFILLAAITGGALSWFASTFPDGLEWSIERVYGKPELPDQEQGITAVLKGIQDKTAFLPDYNFQKPEYAGQQEKPSSWPSVDAGTSLSGILGAGIVLAVVLIIGLGIRAIRGRRS